VTVSDKKVQSVVWSHDLTDVYLDPHTSKTIAAYIPEQHADRRCDRALPGGTITTADRDAPWCDLCVTHDANRATHRRIMDRWRRRAA
jgi:hypothetical protein